MKKVADVRLGWKKSPSADVSEVQVTLVKNGSTSTVKFGPEVEEYVVTLEAGAAVRFQVVVKDDEGLVSESEVHDFTLGNLEKPAPATDLFHEILAIREVPDDEVV